MLSKPSTLSMGNPVKLRFAVLLAAYNGIAYLQEQIDSILLQEGVMVELFISVDISIDGSERWIDEIALDDSRIHVLPHGQKFGGAAPNFFRLFRDVSFNNFDYISLSDQDDIWLPQKLLRAQQVLEGRSAQAYSSNALAFWEDGKTAFICKSQAQTQWDYLFEAAGPGCTYVLKIALAKEIQLVAIEKLGDIAMVGLHDWFIYAYARSKGYRWHIDDQALIHYRQHSQNQVGINSGLKAFVHRARKVSSGWALKQSILIARLIEVENVPFVKRWIDSRPLDLCLLSFSFWSCRRRLRDKFLFLMTCLYLAFTGGKHG
jgi:rhamnosyltransferase